jgi:CDP-glycerol glycerophosphotransferase
MVSVVVIGYNDAEHLPTAVRSVTRQTLRDLEIIVVDDASTDEMPEVAAALARADSRIRVIRLDSNSGGCSKPRNVGMAAAVGRYVMFLDSDDVLTRRACERLATAADRAGAEVGCGRAVRRHLHPRRYISRYDELYTRPRVLDNLAELPGLLYDTTCWNKIYRRDFLVEQGMQFPEGMLYEDLPFTAQALLAAQRIAVIPDLVYVWNGRREAVDPSITIRRDLKSWQDRIEANRLIDKVFAHVGADPVVRAARAQKFLDKDMELFLRELREFPSSLRPALMQLVGDYVAEVDAATAAGALPSRVGAFLASQGDVERTLVAADWSATGGAAGDVREVGSRLYWTGAYLDDPAGRAALDVTETDWCDAGFAATPFLVTATRAEAEGNDVHLNGVVTDLLGRLHGVDSCSLVVRGRAGGRLWSTKATCVTDPVGLAFQARVDLAAVGARLFHPTVGHELRLSLVLRRDGQTVERPLTGRDSDLPQHAFPLPTRWHALVGDQVHLREVNGRLVFALSALPARVDALIDAASLVRYTARRATLRARDLRAGVSGR